MAPSDTKAIVIKAKGQAAVETVPTPKLRDHYILVKTTAVGLNPTDWKHIHGVIPGTFLGARVGCDYAGVVEEVGSKVTKPFKKGDRVAGLTHGSNAVQHEDGSFAEYIVAKADVAIKIDNLTDVEGATLGVGITTVGQGLYQSLKLAPPTAPLKTAEPILIYGGSSGMGIFGVQFAKASGYRVIATASPHNFDYVKSLGDDAVFDYNSPSCAADIKKATGGKLRLAWDCIASADTARLCASAMDEEQGGQYSSLLNVPDEVVKGVNAKVSNAATLGYTAIGEPFEMGTSWPAQPEHLEFARGFWELSRGLLENGVVKVPRTFVNRGGKGLEGVLVGLDELKAGKVSGGKLVYTL